MKNRLQVLDAVLDASPLAIVAVDSSGLVLVWNQGAERILGWSAEETIGQRVPVDSQLLLNTEGRADVRLHRKDGVPIDAEVRTAFWPDGRGRVAIFSDIGHDRVVEKKLIHAEQELERVAAKEKQARSEARIERRFRELLEAAPDAIIEVDREGRIVLLNLVTEKLFGYSREELLGQPVEILIPDAFAPDTCRHREGLLGSSGHAPHGQRPGARMDAAKTVSASRSRSA